MKNNIEKYLQRRHMSQSQLAMIASCTIVSMSRYVRGDREPKVSMAIRIANALKADVYDVFPVIDDKEDEE